MKIYNWEIGTLGKIGIAIGFAGPLVGASLIASGNLDLDWIGTVLFIVGGIIVIVDLFRHRKKRSA